MGVSPPGHCDCAGGHELSGGHHSQIAHVHKQIQASHQRDGYDDRTRKIHLVQNTDKK